MIPVERTPSAQVRTLVLVAGATVLMLAAEIASSDVLRGHLSGFPHADARVDLRVRLFESPAAEAPLAEHRFESVQLRGGNFSVALDPGDVPPGAQFVAIALRPSARPYAAYRQIPPRRPLERMAGDMRIAAVPFEDAHRYTAVLLSTAESTALVHPGEPR